MLYLAEFYLPAGSALPAIALRAIAGAQQAASRGPSIAFMEAILLPQDETCFLLYQAQRSTDVTTAGSLAMLGFDRVTSAIVSRQTGT